MKKKFTMLFAALLAFAGVAKAQFVETSTAEAPKYYVIASYNRGGYLTLENSTIGTGATHVALAEGSYWYFEAADNGGVHFVNKLKGEDDAKIYLGSERKASTTAAAWYVLENGVNKKGLSISSTAAISAYNCIDANNNNNGVGGWHPSANDWQGTTWVFVEAATLQDATYNPEGLLFRTRADRYVTSVALNGGFNNSAVVNHDYKGDNGLVYNDLTKTVTMKAVAGEEVTASITRDGKWTNAYVYIDYDNDGFTAGINEEDGFTPAEDLVSYSFYSGDETNGDSGKNSAGDELTGDPRNTISLPSFEAPAASGTYRMRFKIDWNSINPNGGNSNFMTDGGSFIDVTLEVVSSTIDVVYTYKYNGEVKFTQTSKAVVGDEFPALNQTLPYGVTATKPAGNIAESDVVDGKVAKDIEITNSLPFVAAADNKSISKWYYINIHTNPSNTGFLQYTEENTYIACELRGQVAADNKDAYTWAFVGNVFDGFKLVNKKAGTNMAVNSDGSSAPVLGNYATGVNWQMIASRTNTAAQYFCFDYPNNGDCLNAPTSGQLSFWWDNDNGSTMWVTERDDAAQIKALVENAKGILAALGEGETVGYVTAASKTTLSNAITTAETAMKTWEGIDAAEAGLQEALANLETIQPEEGVFYTLKNKNTSRYMNVSATAGLVATTSVGIGEVFQFVKNDGNLYLKNVERGTYLSTAKAHTWGQNSAAATAIADAKAVVVNNLGKDNQVSITPVGGGQLHHDTNNNNVVAWNGEVDSKSSWTIEAIDITALSHVVSISDVKWSTLVLGYDAIIPEGVTAYVVSSVDTYANLTEVTGTIPANEAVLLNGVAGNHAFKFAESATAVETNLLKGSTVNTTVAEAAYILAAKEGVVGLYEVTLDQNEGSAFTNNAFKVYLPASTRPAGTEAPAMFSFGRGEGTTGVDQFIANEEVVIYDLAGRRVEKMEKGIYIVNGKKVIR